MKKHQRRYNLILIVFFSLLLGCSIMLRPTNAVAQPEAKTIEMEGTDNLKFTVKEITARPGQKITVKLTTVSDYPKAAMAHNFVLLTADADATKVANLSARAVENDYIAPSMTDRIIAYTAMAGGGETVEVTFKAPGEPGEYEYICTFPGHFAAGMKGTLIVEAK
ncbi:MAG: plastocyanin/azurin family copper-binding protein [Balneolaceae bacterium]|nr:plastocyanin/azurin family copper-binding protein [Balneolaceae bacterium]